MEFKKANKQRSTPPTASLPVKPVVVSEPPSTSTPATKPLSKASKQLPPWLTKKPVAIGVIVAAVIAGIAGAIYYTNANSAATANAKPTFATLLPEKKKITDLGGWKRVSPPQNEPVFAYTDTLAGTSVSVSQQPLPPAFKSNPKSQVAELARKFNATSKIDVNGTDVYIGTSAKGPQSVIFAKKDLLILIKSQNKVDDMTWASYIASLI